MTWILQLFSAAVLFLVQLSKCQNFFCSSGVVFSAKLLKLLFWLHINWLNKTCLCTTEGNQARQIQARKACLSSYFIKLLPKYVIDNLPRAAAEVKVKRSLGFVFRVFACCCQSGDLYRTERSLVIWLKRLSVNSECVCLHHSGCTFNQPVSLLNDACHTRRWWHLGRRRTLGHCSACNWIIHSLAHLIKRWRASCHDRIHHFLACYTILELFVDFELYQETRLLFHQA